MKYEHFETKLEKENEYPKLVRDKISEIVEQITGKKVKTEILEEDEKFFKFLLKKVVEEASELAETKDREHLVEEMGDVMELLDTILEFSGLDWETVRKVQKEKADKRGGFKKRILMLEGVE
ncbi:MAG: nucleoside triphosphate pyrophosphohydrolase [Candidatus Moraniibacteriota bacterium]